MGIQALRAVIVLAVFVVGSLLFLVSNTLGKALGLAGLMGVVMILALVLAFTIGSVRKRLPKSNYLSRNPWRGVAMAAIGLTLLAWLASNFFTECVSAAAGCLDGAQLSSLLKLFSTVSCIIWAIHALTEPRDSR